MKALLNQTLSDNCYGYLQDFQLSGIDLPNVFELAIQETQLQDQQIITARSQKINVEIELTTAVEKAKIS